MYVCMYVCTILFVFLITTYVKYKTQAFQQDTNQDIKAKKTTLAYFPNMFPFKMSSGTSAICL